VSSERSVVNFAGLFRNNKPIVLLKFPVQ